MGAAEDVLVVLPRVNGNCSKVRGANSPSFQGRNQYGRGAAAFHSEHVCCGQRSGGKGQGFGREIGCRVLIRPIKCRCWNGECCDGVDETCNRIHAPYVLCRVPAVRVVHVLSSWVFKFLMFTTE